MAISYANSPYTFVDSNFGTGSASNIKTLVPQVVDIKFHRVVQAKNWWKLNGMIGADTYSEGDGSETVGGVPVLRKSELNAQKGDVIKMGQSTNLSTSYNTGIVGGFQLVDSEVGWDMNHQYVKIEQWRQGVRTNLGMNDQRNPYMSFEEQELKLLSDWQAQQEDNGLTYALHYGYAPHLFRQYGTTNLPPLESVHTIIGNDITMTETNTVANLDGAGADNVKAKTFEIGFAYAVKSNFDLVDVGGEKYLLAFISPAARLALYQDDKFRRAAELARERGNDNPLFKYATFAYANVLIFTYQKIESLLAGYNPAGLTVSNTGAYNSSITEASYTGIGGGLSASQLHQTYFVGANALCLAEGRMGMRERVENDYGIILGRAVDAIWGAKRADWLNEAENTRTNQSSFKIINTLVNV